MENLTLDLNEVFNEVMSRQQSEGAMKKEEYIDLVEEVLEEKREEGLIDDDYDFQEARESIEARWPEAEEAQREFHSREQSEEDQY